MNDRELLLALQAKIPQVKNAKSQAHITGIKALRGYSRHYRIIIKTERHSYRIGAIVRGDKIWFVRFLPRKKIYSEFP